MEYQIGDRGALEHLVALHAQAVEANRQLAAASRLLLAGTGAPDGTYRIEEVRPEEGLLVLSKTEQGEAEQSE